jgi:hypothetical protein
MASGRLGKNSAGNGTTNVIYTAPGAVLFATVNIIVCNTSGATRLIRTAVSVGGAPTAVDWLDYDQELIAGQTREITAVVMTAGESVLCQANGPGVVARVHGHEKL